MKKEDLRPFLTIILKKMEILLKSGCNYLKESAIITLTSVVQTANGDFIGYWQSFIVHFNGSFE